MATLRLFANLRESAGTDRVIIDAETVGEVLDAASERFGERFRSGLGSARVWVNGNQADTTTPLAPSDEIALIPPVSGGAVAMSNLVATPGLLSFALIVAMLAVAWADEKWSVFVAVGALLAWVWDVSESAHRTRDGFVAYPPLIGTAVGASLSYAYGFEGFAGGMALAFVIAVTWPVFHKPSRVFRTTAATALVTILATAAASGLVLMRLIGTHAILAFIVVVTFAVAGAFLAGTYGDAVQSIDANVGALLGALLGGLIVGFGIAEVDVAAGLLGGVAAAAGVIAGRAFGSTLRTGSIIHTENAPGAVALFDGVVLAAPLAWMTIWFFG